MLHISAALHNKELHFVRNVMPQCGFSATYCPMILQLRERRLQRDPAGLRL
jgi:hypothetical protein